MPGLNLDAWRFELATVPDRELLLTGVINGFDIVDNDVQIVPVEVANHPSASPGHGNYEAVKRQVLSEISVGNYIVCESKPVLISIYLHDTKLPFGSRLAPGIFHRLTQSVKRMMARRGFTALVVYLDDFLISAPTMKECATALSTLVSLLRHLGFCINWDKVVDPTRRITFLGIEINTETMSKRLPVDNLLALRSEFQVFAKRKAAIDSYSPLQGS